MCALSSTKICRACLSTTCIRFYPIFEHMPRSNLKISEMLLLCGLNVVENDGLPGRLCSSCFNTLESTTNFIKQYKIAQDLYREQLKNPVIVIDDEPPTKKTKIKQEKVGTDTALIKVKVEMEKQAPCNIVSTNHNDNVKTERMKVNSEDSSSALGIPEIIKEQESTHFDATKASPSRYCYQKKDAMPLVQQNAKGCKGINQTYKDGA